MPKKRKQTRNIFFIQSLTELRDEAYTEQNMPQYHAFSKVRDSQSITSLLIPWVKCTCTISDWFCRHWNPWKVILSKLILKRVASYRALGHILKENWKRSWSFMKVCFHLCFQWCVLYLGFIRKSFSYSSRNSRVRSSIVHIRNGSKRIAESNRKCSIPNCQGIVQFLMNNPRANLG